MKKILTAAFAAFLFHGAAAFAQSVPTWLAYGVIPSAAQWQGAFAAKQDIIGYTPVNKAGDMLTGELITAPSLSSAAGFLVTPGVVPGTPRNGEMWVTGTGIFVQIGGSTIQLGVSSGITALTGDATASGTGSVPITFATVNSNVGTWGDATHVGSVTVNGKGLVTAASSVIIAPPFSAITGSLACSQTPALTGDVTTSAGACATTIATNAVTYAKFQQVAASSLVGNATGSLANAMGITLGSTLAFSGSALQTAAITGDATASANSFATTVVKIRGNAIKSGTPSDGQVLTWVTANSDWEPLAAPSGNVPTGGTTGQALVKNSNTDYDTAWQTVAGLGTVTSVALAMPGIFTVSGSPVTSTGTLTAALATEAKNLVFAGPSSGSDAAPTFRALIGADLPNPGASSLGGVQSIAAVTHQFLTSISTLGVPVLAQPAAADLSNGVTGSGAVALATSPTFVTPTLGAATATSVNKVAITAPASGSTLTIADGKTATVSNTLTFTGTDSSSVAFGTGGTIAYTNVATLSSLTSVGTIGTGIWQGTAVGTAYGGTGAANLNAFMLAGTTNTITVGYAWTPNNLGTITSGTTTLDCTAGNYQYATNNGAFTLAPSSASCGIDLKVTNGASAGAITFSGWTVGTNTGSSLDTTSGHKFIISARRINGDPTYSVYALQ